MIRATGVGLGGRPPRRAPSHEVPGEVPVHLERGDSILAERLAEPAIVFSAGFFGRPASRAP
jgi:hypothetical protein